MFVKEIDLNSRPSDSRSHPLLMGRCHSSDVRPEQGREGHVLNCRTRYLTGNRSATNWVRLFVLLLLALVQAPSIAAVHVDAAAWRFFAEPNFKGGGFNGSESGAAEASLDGALAFAYADTRKGIVRVLVDTTDHVTGINQSAEQYLKSQWFTSGVANAGGSGDFMVRKRTDFATDTVKLRFHFAGMIFPPTSLPYGEAIFSITGNLHSSSPNGVVQNQSFSAGASCNAQGLCFMANHVRIIGEYDPEISSYVGVAGWDIPMDTRIGFSVAVSARAAGGGDVFAQNSAYVWLELTDGHELISDANSFLTEAIGPAAMVPELPIHTLSLTGLLILALFSRFRKTCRPRPYCWRRHVRRRALDDNCITANAPVL